MPLLRPPTRLAQNHTIYEPGTEAMAPNDVGEFLYQHGWTRMDVYWMHSQTPYYFTWAEAIAYEMFKKFTLGAYDVSS